MFCNDISASIDTSVSGVRGIVSYTEARLSRLPMLLT